MRRGTGASPAKGTWNRVSVPVAVRGALAQPRGIELIDDSGVRIGNDIHRETIAVGEGIDMMKGEGGVGDRAAHQPPFVLLDDMKDQPALRLPAIVLDEGLAREPEFDRIDQQRELGEHEVILAHAEAVHVSGPLDRDRRDHLLLAVVADPAQAI